MTTTPTSDPDGGGVGTIDRSHLLLIGAGPGLGVAVARRFAVGGYRVTLVARSADGLGELAGTLADTARLHRHRVRQPTSRSRRRRTVSGRVPADPERSARPRRPLL